MLDVPNRWDSNSRSMSADSSGNAKNLSSRRRMNLESVVRAENKKIKFRLR